MGRRRRQARQAHVVSPERKAEAGETVIFAWITYKSRAQRDKINAKVMADSRLKSMMDGKAPPFDAKRMIYGGFGSR
jgi:uncharacterized protein YbaA (DUF1428 family)